MDFDLTEDQLALRAGASDVLDDLASPARVRAHTTTDAPFDRALWRAMVDQGWLGVELDEAARRARARLGRGRGAGRGARAPRRAGAVRPHRPRARRVRRAPATTRWVERLLGGDAIACVAWDAAAPVPYAPSADVAIVLADDGVYAIELDRHGRRARAGDGSHPRAGLARSSIPRPRAGSAARTTRRGSLDRGATFTSADLLGSASHALDLAVEYAKDRVQFGRPIGSFQAVKHRCADMLVDVEGMRSTVYWAAWCIGAGDADASVAASTAKIWCGDASKRVMASALQVHGGIGFTWEHDLHFFLKRAQLDQLAFGDASAHRERLAALLRPRVEAGESVV